MKQQKMRKHHLMRVLLFTALPIILLYACRKELHQINDAKQSLTIEEAKGYMAQKERVTIPIDQMSFSEFNNKDLAYAWDKAKVSMNDQGNVIEVPLTNKNKGYVIGSDNPDLANKSITTLIVTKNEKGEKTSFLMTLVADQSYLKDKPDDLSKNSYKKYTSSFSGLVLYHKPEGVFISGDRYLKGQKVGPLVAVSELELRKIGSASSGQNKVMNYALPGDGDDCTYYTMYDYNAVCYPVDANIICEWERSVRWSYKVCEDSGGGYGTGGTGNNQFSIDQTALKECMKKIVDSLKKSTKGNVAAIIQQFAGETPGYNWTLKDGTLSSSWNAETSGKYNRTTGTVTTIFDSKKFAASSDLSVARTVLHESVHAYLLAYFFTNQMVARETYSEYYEEYIKHKNRSANTLQHNEIARNFVGYIGEALREYGDRMGYTFASQTEKEQYYNDLAWGGLTDTAAFRTLNTSDKNRIEDVISSELAGIDRFGDPKPAKGSVSGCSN